MSSNLRKPFGEQIPFCEPYWYQGFPSAYYRESHVSYRAKCRKFVEEEIKPFVDDWVKAGSYPLDLHEKCFNAGITCMSRFAFLLLSDSHL